ncbi:MAG: epoxyqueuosine reductase [Lawsonibacter sp.]|nr:epoxyqueuosine reductase [Lawsonibacter sp.]
MDTSATDEVDADSLTEQLKEELYRQRADLVGVGDLTALPESSRGKLPFGISIAVKFPKDVVSGIVDLPTREYYDWYNKVNGTLSQIASHAVTTLKDLGYQATTRTGLPQKTVATRAGIGWVGKSNLLVTEQYGSMIRLAAVLTDAPLTAAEPINESKCGDCRLCVDACPAGALAGKLWDTTVSRDEILDTSACSAMAVSRSIQGFGVPIELCGKCFAVCKYTQQYINSEEE